MKSKTIYFITGLPRSGSSVITNILSQNPQIHGEVNGSLASLFGAVHLNWQNLSNDLNIQKKRNVLNGIINGFYEDIDKPIIFDRNINWMPYFGVLESVLQKEIKVLVCVRNPAEILTSFEKDRKENPLVVLNADQRLKDETSIAARSYHYAGPEGILGTSHRNLKDSITMGFLDRCLFIDYGRFCSNPKSQTKRIYDFFELPEFQHDYKNIIGPNMATRNELSKHTVNCVEYLGLDLYEQYNREIFWNALI